MARFYTNWADWIYLWLCWLTEQLGCWDFYSEMSQIDLEKLQAALLSTGQKVREPNQVLGQYRGGSYRQGMVVTQARKNYCSIVKVVTTLEMLPLVKKESSSFLCQKFASGWPVLNVTDISLSKSLCKHLWVWALSQVEMWIIQSVPSVLPHCVSVLVCCVSVTFEVTTQPLHLWCVSSFWWLLAERLKTNTKVRLHRCREPFNHKSHKMKLLAGFSSPGRGFSGYFQFFVAVSFPCQQVTITASQWSAHWRFVPSSALLSPPPGCFPMPTPGPKIRSVVGLLLHPPSNPLSSRQARQFT